MIKNIIFDFGDIFIDLNKLATSEALYKFGFREFTPELVHLSQTYEKGLISTTEFIDTAHAIFPKATQNELVSAWNAIILSFPEKRLHFIQRLANEANYRLFLLSNTNALHIEQVIQNMGANRYEKFKNCFEQFYLSHEIHMRKPDAEIFAYVLEENQLLASESLFIDDTAENTDAAKKAGLYAWNLKVGVEDITELKSYIPTTV